VARAHRVGLVEDEALSQIEPGGGRREGETEQEGDQGEDAPLEGSKGIVTPPYCCRRIYAGLPEPPYFKRLRSWCTHCDAFPLVPTPIRITAGYLKHG
jgi:hypothetical protein